MDGGSFYRVLPRRGFVLDPSDEHCENRAVCGVAAAPRGNRSVNANKNERGREDSAGDAKIHVLFQRILPRKLAVARAVPLFETPARRRESTDRTGGSSSTPSWEGGGENFAHKFSRRRIKRPVRTEGYARHTRAREAGGRVGAPTGETLRVQRMGY